jgi:hypothetical protein
VTNDFFVSLAFKARSFYKDLNTTLEQLTKMESHLASNRPVGMLPETLRAQQTQFMVSEFLFRLHFKVDVRRQCQNYMLNEKRSALLILIGWTLMSLL